MDTVEFESIIAESHQITEYVVSALEIIFGVRVSHVYAWGVRKALNEHNFRNQLMSKSSHLILFFPLNKNLCCRRVSNLYA